jgi:hypothetical protein
LRRRTLTGISSIDTDDEITLSVVQVVIPKIFTCELNRVPAELSDVQGGPAEDFVVQTAPSDLLCEAPDDTSLKESCPSMGLQYEQGQSLFIFEVVVGTSFCALRVGSK